MTKVFVHGNPETSAVWAPLQAALERRGVDDIILLSPPGFGSPVPTGFTGTQSAYRDWLIREIEMIGRPVDLLGHDWGAGHTYGVASARPDLLRSWAADCAGLVHPAYEWHSAAQTWQREGDGEDLAAQLVSLSADQLVEQYGVPSGLSDNMAQNMDDTMGACILNLYRSAAQPAMRDLGDDLFAADRRPALLIHATDDPYVPGPLVFDVAERTGAHILTLQAWGHWWMWQDPDGAAEGLIEFWASA